MDRKDYYKALGLRNTAQQEEIVKAYRRLAQRYHPDVNDSPGAEEKFKEIAAAYEVLGDREKRSKYDRDNQYGFPSLRDLWRPWRTRAGWGHDVGPGFRGVVPRDHAPEDITDPRLRRRGEDREAVLDVPLRDALRGALRTIELIRVERDMYGAVQRVREFLEVEVPRGATAGSVILVRGHGNPGRGGGGYGDLYLRVRIVPD